MATKGLDESTWRRKDLATKGLESTCLDFLYTDSHFESEVV